MQDEITLQHIQHYYCQIKSIDEILDQYNFTWHELWAVLENARPFFDNGNPLLNIYNYEELNGHE